MCIAKRNLLDISEIHATSSSHFPEMALSISKNGGFLMPFKWGCGGQEVPDDSL